MVKKTDIGWRTVENSLSKRMIDNSLIHLFDENHAPISEKTQFINKELSKFFVIKDYDQYVKLKTRALRKFDKLNVSDDSFDSDEVTIYNLKTNSANKKTEQKNSKKKKSNEVSVKSKRKSRIIQKKRRSQRRTTKKSYNDLSNDENDVNLADVNNSDLSSSNNIKGSSPIADNHSTINPIDKNTSIEGHLGESSIDKHKNTEDHLAENPSIEDQNIEDYSVENPSDEDLNIEEYSLEYSSDENRDIEDNSIENLIEEQIIKDNLIEDLIDDSQNVNDNKLEKASSEKSDNDELFEDDILAISDELVEDDTLAISQSQNIDSIKDKPVLKITSTEVVKPKYTIVKDSTMAVATNSFNSQNSSKDLFDDESEEDNEDLVSKTIDQAKIMAERQVIIHKNGVSLIKQIYNSSSEDEESETSLENISKCTSQVDNYREASNSLIKKDIKKGSNVLDEAYYEENIFEDEMKANETADALEYQIPNERDSLEYILQHMSHLKNIENQHSFDTEYLNRNFIHIRDEPTDNLMSEEESDSSFIQPEISYGKPTTLDEFARMNNLVPMENRPSTITLEDLSDSDEFFVMEIPKSIVDKQQLVGKEMEIKKKSLIIGDTKYRLQRRKNEPVTCILRENNEEMSFKAVNIEPKESFVVGQRLSSRIMKPCSLLVINNTNGRAPFPKNLRIRNPLENKNKKLKRYREKTINDKGNIYRKTKLKLER